MSIIFYSKRCMSVKYIKNSGQLDLIFNKDQFKYIKNTFKKEFNKEDKNK